ncbi:MAG: hypothetical protein HC911_17955 [Chloroflexaceae bacterium]|nr:hypothetical protein [Chloroflexaceae bacterium]
MVLINFSHPLTAEQVQQLTATLGDAPDVRLIPVQIDQQQPLEAQVRALVESIGLTPTQWQTEPIIVNPPGLAPVAVVLLAELHGRMGLFPAIVRMRPIAGSTPTRFEVAEIINVQQVRETARQHREPRLP